ncbi:unnamed protein product [Cuscuta epithymum]|uniref:Uncharacterized protein n=1 Tax=Cuscuta epithymum TaxID=186058 RepID=A0AAV0GE42_9ASTE|nr:unnamed protein product [Cuscuta epithymum]
MKEELGALHKNGTLRNAEKWFSHL